MTPERQKARTRLKEVGNWAYQIQGQSHEDNLEKLARSGYDMLVVDAVSSDKDEGDYPEKEAVKRMQKGRGKGKARLVLAYIDVGEAEAWRYYWKEGWRVGKPSFILAQDPDGWEGNFPVAYWRKEWKEIWMGGADPFLDRIIACGYDGVYLDWLEGAYFEPVIEEAGREGKDARIEMIKFAMELAHYLRSRRKSILVVGQNAVELVEPRDKWSSLYLETLDGQAQEHVWFDGDSDPGGLPGDIPIAAEGEYGTRWYVEALKRFQKAGLPIFTVDYARNPGNVSKTYETAKKNGFVEYVTTRQLDTLSSTPAPGGDPGGK